MKRKKIGSYRSLVNFLVISKFGSNDYIGSMIKMRYEGRFAMFYNFGLFVLLVSV